MEGEVKFEVLIRQECLDEIERLRASFKDGRFVLVNPEELPPPILTDNKKEDKEGTDGGGSGS